MYYTNRRELIILDNTVRLRNSSRKYDRVIFIRRNRRDKTLIFNEIKLTL